MTICVDIVLSIIIFILSVLVLFGSYLKCTFIFASKSKVCLIGKTAIVTGGNKGIGFQTALGLATRGCKVIIACRHDLEETKRKIIDETNNGNIHVKYLDMLSLDSVRQFCKDINDTEDKIDILINNAGVTFVGEGNKYTKDGLHSTMQANLFGSFLLTHLLIDLMKKSDDARIIFVSSILAFLNKLTIDNVNYHEHHPINFRTLVKLYGNSKAGQIIVSNELAEKLKPFGIKSNALHPGFGKTNIFEPFDAVKWKPYLKKVFTWALKLAQLFAKDTEACAQRSIFMAISNEYKHINGAFVYTLWNWLPQPKCAADRQFRKQFWQALENYVKLLPHEKI